LAFVRPETQKGEKNKALRKANSSQRGGSCPKGPPQERVLFEDLSSSSGRGEKKNSFDYFVWVLPAKKGRGKKRGGGKREGWEERGSKKSVAGPVSSLFDKHFTF